MGVRSHIVTVWSMQIDGPPSPAQLASWRDVLSADELADIDRSYGSVARQSSIAAHALLRGLLQVIGRQPARDWRFALTGAGKPIPLGDPGRRAPHCSLTHTDDLVACAASAEFPIGIDAELRTRTVSSEAVNSVLAPAEIGLVNAVCAQQRSETFLRLWTLREAYLKALGRGLHFPHEAFSFTLDPPRIAFEEEVDEADPASWQFHTWSAERHVFSLAMHCHRTTPLSFVKRAVTPDQLSSALERGGEIKPDPTARDAAQNRIPSKLAVRVDEPISLK
jgi:4'-phosphopantetheinyl transferase